MWARYIYEELFLNSKDLKVYTIGPGYAHGEMRKSPVVDGIVERDPDKKELRLLTKLSEEEKQIAAQICVVIQAEYMRIRHHSLPRKVIRHRRQRLELRQRSTPPLPQQSPRPCSIRSLAAQSLPLLLCALSLSHVQHAATTTSARVF